MGRNNTEITDRTRAAIKELADCVNVMGAEQAVADAIAAELCHTHRTLQSSVICAFATAMVSYADMPTDLRNEAAVEFAKKVAAMEHYFPYI